MAQLVTRNEPVEVSFPLPRSMDARVHLSLITREKSIIAFVTTTTPEAKGSTPMGSFVYALPNSLKPSEPLATALFTVESTLEFATRLAKLLAKKTHLPVYVSSSLRLEAAAMGGNVEEEMEAFKKIVDISLKVLQPAISAAS
ncbi:hypothetical protein MKZ38_007742 [Zalerion maritima]|uniref:Uncharacterized protein n=1 Tax=Zalerion maritima TaxID=339359 RepID=A0AAD5RIA5_9PEZI|nr:hypothetical protein MKZ38_007742 [Zalerion maritima]